MGGTAVLAGPLDEPMEPGRPFPTNSRLVESAGQRVRRCSEFLVLARRVCLSSPPFVEAEGVVSGPAVAGVFLGELLLWGAQLPHLSWEHLPMTWTSSSSESEEDDSEEEESVEEPE